MTTAQEGGKVVSLTHRPHLPPENPPGTHFFWRLIRPHGYSGTVHWASKLFIFHSKSSSITNYLPYRRINYDVCRPNSVPKHTSQFSEINCTEVYFEIFELVTKFSTLSTAVMLKTPNRCEGFMSLHCFVSLSKYSVLKTDIL